MAHRAGRPVVRPVNVSAAAGRRIVSRRAVERSRRFAAVRVEPVDRLEPVTADGGPPPVSWSQVDVVVVAVRNRRLCTDFSRAPAPCRAREAVGVAGGVVGLVLDRGAHPQRRVQPWSGCRSPRRTRRSPSAARRGSSILPSGRRGAAAPWSASRRTSRRRRCRSTSRRRPSTARCRRHGRSGRRSDRCIGRRGRSDGSCPWPAGAADGHLQRRDDELWRMWRRHRPADDPAAEEVLHRGQIQPALAGLDLLDVRGPHPVRRVGPEVAADEVAERLNALHAAPCSPCGGAGGRPAGPPRASAAPRASRRPGSPGGAASRAPAGCRSGPCWPRGSRGCARSATRHATPDPTARRRAHAQYPDSETPSSSHCRETDSSLAFLASEMCR